MATFANAIKNEISRLARKEVRAQIEQLKAVSSRHRAEIAALKKEIRTLRKDLGRWRSSASEATRWGAEEASAPAVRFSAKALHRQRARLALSAAQLSQILGVSSQSIYHWEQGKSRPRPAQIQAIAKLRTLRKREALDLLRQ